MGGSVRAPWPRPTAAVLAALLLAATAPLGALAGPSPQALPSALPAPGWAVGFNWTYRYVGPYYEQIGSGTVTYEASYVNDTYTSSVVGEVSTPSGPAWVVRNDHAGTMQGNATAPIVGRVPASATFTSVTFAWVRKANLAILNFTQDLNVTTSSLPIVGSVSGSAHNETVATPPLEQVVFGTPADGTVWHIASNLTSTGWYEVGSSGQVATSSYLALDYNLSVAGVTNVTVPAGTFEVYNITGGGVADNNGDVRSFNQSFLWSPLVQNKVVDEGGYLLLGYEVNRPPELAVALPVVNVTAGEGVDVDLTGHFSDPDGDPFTVACQAPAGLQCSVGAGDVLNITADPGQNATLNITLTVDDGRPGGRATFALIVLVTGAGSTNQPPVALPHGTLTTPEDTPYHFTVSDFFSDPDDGIASHQASAALPLAVSNVTATGFDVVAPQDFNGVSQFTVTVFDFGGLSNASTFVLQVTAVNDAPALAAVGPLTKTAHVGQNVTFAVVGTDVDGDPLSYAWHLDGSPVGTGSSMELSAALAGAGAHTLRVVVSDGQGANATLDYGLLVFVGPQIIGQTPASTALTVGTGSSVRFAISATDPDSTVLDYRWERDGTQVVAGTGRDNATFDFPAPGSFVVRATVADNGSNDSVEWQVTVVEVPGGLVSIESPVGGAILRVDEGGSLMLLAAIDGNLTAVTLEWTVDGAVVSSAVTFDWPVPRSGEYLIALHANATYLGSVAYSASDEVTVSILVVVAPNPGNGNNSNNTNNTNNTQPPPEPGADYSIYYLLVLIVILAAGTATYLWWRKRNGRADP